MNYLKKLNLPSAPIVICKTDDEVAANELLCLLWDLWQLQLPNETDIELAFPKEYRKALIERLADLKREQFETLKEIRELKNKRVPTDLPKKTHINLTTLIKRIEWKLRPPTGKEGFDLESAKLVPITNFIEFNRQNFAKCPWHTEKSASLKYYPQQNRCYCFGCNKGGDVIDVVRVLFDLSLQDAIKKLTN